jgi:membrane protein YqaA with SNARE-associated domain
MFDALASLGLMAVTAFVAATIFPAQSELVFVGLLKAWVLGITHGSSPKASMTRGVAIGIWRFSLCVLVRNYEKCYKLRHEN